MIPKFYLSSLRAKVDAIGQVPPELSPEQSDYRPIVTLVVDTDECGYIIISIWLDYLNTASAVKKGSRLGYYSWGDYALAYSDAVTLAKYWRRPLLKASKDRGWLMVSTGVEIGVLDISDIDAKKEM